MIKSKRFLSVFLSIILVVSITAVSVPTVSAVDVTTNENILAAMAEYENELMTNSGLEVTQDNITASVVSNENGIDATLVANMIKKAMNGEDITIVAFGGSITQGGDAKEEPETTDFTHSYTDKKNYVELVGDWFTEMFKSCGGKVNMINAGIGATDTVFGIHRMQDDVLAYSPDLVILEWDKNDANNDNAKQATYENMMRKFLDKSIAVVLLGMCGSTTASSQIMHEPLANHYSVPYISYRNAFGDESYLSKLTNDGTHPNTVGHHLTALLLTSYFADVYGKISAITDTEYTMPSTSYIDEATVYGDGTIAKLTDVEDGRYDNIIIKETGSFVRDDTRNPVKNGSRSYYPYIAEYKAEGNYEPMVLEITKPKTLFLLIERNKGVANGEFSVSYKVSEDADTPVEDPNGSFDTGSGSTDNSQIESTYVWATTRVYKGDGNETITVEITPTDISEGGYVGIYGLLLTDDSANFTLKDAASGETTLDVWDGTTSTKPTIIRKSAAVSNAAELYWLFSNSDANLGVDITSIRFTNNIYINDIENFATDDWSTTAPANKWNVTNTINGDFEINGNGYIVYGLYSKNISGDAGLFTRNSKTDTTVSINGLGVDQAYVEGYYASAFFAAKASLARNYHYFRDCFVGENVTIVGKDGLDATTDDTAGGFIGRDLAGSQITAFTFTNCYSLANVSGLENYIGSFMGRPGSANGAARIKMEHCYTNNTLMFGYYGPNHGYNSLAIMGTDATLNYAPNALYSINSASYPYTTACAVEDMQGYKAVLNMSNLGDAYVATKEGYPQLACFVSDDGTNVVGFSDCAFDGGDGSEDNPFLISTSKQLRNAIELFGQGKYFKLTNDIYVNDINAVNWTYDNAEASAHLKDGNDEKVLEWWIKSATDKETTANISDDYYVGLDGSNGVFSGHIDGDGYAVNGLYYPTRAEALSKTDDSDYSEIAALIPVMSDGSVKNLTVSNSRLSVSKNVNDENIEYYNSKDKLSDYTLFYDISAGVIGKVVDGDGVTIEQVTVDDTVGIVRYFNTGANGYIVGAGIVGYASSKNSITMNNVGVSAVFVGTGDEKMGMHRTGGFVGMHNNSNMIIKLTNCYSATMHPVASNQGNASGGNAHYKKITFENVYSTSYPSTFTNGTYFDSTTITTGMNIVENFTALLTDFGGDVWYADTDTEAADKSNLMLRVRGTRIGDVNENGIGGQADDLVTLRRYLLYTVPENNNADVNFDKEVDIRDLVRCKKICSQIF